MPVEMQSLNTTEHSEIRNLRKKTDPFCQKILDPSSNSHHNWVAICSMIYLYNFIFVILRTAFTQFQRLDSWFVWLIFDYAISDPINIIDIAVELRTGLYFNFLFYLNNYI